MTWVRIAYVPQERYALMRVERHLSAKAKVAGQHTRLQSAGPAPLTAPRHGLAQVIYIAAIALATLGWLWLIGWIALTLI
jgi:hypothetical protein